MFGVGKSQNGECLRVIACSQVRLDILQLLKGAKALVVLLYVSDVLLNAEILIVKVSGVEKCYIKLFSS